MEPVKNPHDRFFKETFSRTEVARDFVAHYLPPEIAAVLDTKTLEISKDTFVDEELKESLSDLLYHVALKGKGTVFVYLLFEHKSYPDPAVKLYLLQSMVRIWTQYRKQGNKGPLPPVLPLVVYHGKTEWKIEPAFHAMVGLTDVVGPYVPNFDILLCDLSRYTDEEIKGGALLRVTFLLMKHIFSEDLGRMLPGFLGLLEGFSDSRTGLQYLEAALRYAASGSSHIKSEDIEHALKGVLDDEGGDLMTTLAQQWIEEGHQRGIQEGVLQGIQQGIQQGRQEGRQEGIVNGLLEGIELAIEVKFGTQGLILLPLIQRIEAPEKLKAVKEAVRMAKDLPNLKALILEIKKVQ